MKLFSNTRGHFNDNKGKIVKMILSAFIIVAFFIIQYILTESHIILVGIGILGFTAKGIDIMCDTKFSNNAIKDVQALDNIHLIYFLAILIIFIVVFLFFKKQDQDMEQPIKSLKPIFA